MCPFYPVTQQNKFTAYTAFARRDIPWHLPWLGTRQNRLQKRHVLCLHHHHHHLCHATHRVSLNFASWCHYIGFVFRPVHWRIRDHCTAAQDRTVLAEVWHRADGRILRSDADKSLPRPGRKQATATKLRIYSTYSPQSSIHFYARCFISASVRGSTRTRNKKGLAILHMNIPLFQTTLSTPSYEIGKQIGLRSYQHSYVL